MFDIFPKSREVLNGRYSEIYSEYYKSNRKGATAASALSQWMESWLHKKVALDVVGFSESEMATLELGAGTLNQLQYEPLSAAYDIVEPFNGLFEDSPFRSRIRDAYADISRVPRANRYNRITSVAALEHICNLPEVVARCCLLMHSNGVFRASIPSEGTPLWTLGWKLTTGLEFRCRYGLDYGVLMRHEHVNTADEIEIVLNHFFREIKCSVFGVCRYLSVYRFYECRRPDFDQCRCYLNSIGATCD